MRRVSSILRTIWFADQGLSAFLISILSQYPDLNTKTIKCLLPFDVRIFAKWDFFVLSEMMLKNKCTTDDV